MFFLNQFCFASKWILKRSLGFGRLLVWDFRNIFCKIAISWFPFDKSNTHIEIALLSFSKCKHQALRRRVVEMLRWVGSQEFGVAEHSDTQWYTVVHSDTQWYSGVSEKQNKKQIGGILDLDGGIICWPRKYKSGGDHWKSFFSMKTVRTLSMKSKITSWFGFYRQYLIPIFWTFVQCVWSQQYTM